MVETHPGGNLLPKHFIKEKLIAAPVAHVAQALACGYHSEPQNVRVITDIRCANTG